MQAHPDWHVTTLDKLTYAGRQENLHDVMDNPRHTLRPRRHLRSAPVAGPLVEASDVVVHFAAETHVDRSILAAGDFIRTDVEGTFVLLEAARRNPNLRRFVQISTDEVYGSVAEGSSSETDELRPRNPYSASKAGADRLAYSYWATHDVPVIITRASNNYGPYQFPEKVIPLFVTNLIDDIQVPLYGDGGNVRDWLHVTRPLPRHRPADPRGTERRGLQHRRRQRGEERGPHPRAAGAGRQGRVADPPRRGPQGPRPPLQRQHGEAPQHGLDAEVDFEQGLQETVAWYQQNEWWWRPVKERDPQYQAYIEQQYGKRKSH